MALNGAFCYTEQDKHKLRKASAMIKKLSNERGFSPIEIIMVIVIVGLLAAVGYMFYKGNHKAATKTTTTTTATKSTTTTPAKTTDPYAGWKSGTTKYEKINYKYPADWTVKDTSVATEKGDCVYPGADHVKLAAPSGARVSLSTGINCIGDGDSIPYGADSINALGQNLYLVYENYQEPDANTKPAGPAFACLAKTKTPTTPIDFDNKNITSDTENKPRGSFCYYPYPDSDTIAAKASTISAIQSTADFANAKLILESMKY